MLVTARTGGNQGDEPSERPSSVTGEMDVTVQLTKAMRCHTGHRLEDLTEVSRFTVSGRGRNLLDLHVVLDEQCLGVPDPALMYRRGDCVADRPAERA